MCKKICVLMQLWQIKQKKNEDWSRRGRRNEPITKCCYYLPFSVSNIYYYYYYDYFSSSSSCRSFSCALLLSIDLCRFSSYWRQVIFSNFDELLFVDCKEKINKWCIYSYKLQFIYSFFFKYQIKFYLSVGAKWMTKFDVGQCW